MKQKPHLLNADDATEFAEVVLQVLVFDQVSQAADEDPLDADAGVALRLLPRSGALRLDLGVVDAVRPVPLNLVNHFRSLERHEACEKFQPFQPSGSNCDGRFHRWHNSCNLSVRSCLGLDPIRANT